VWSPNGQLRHIHKEFGPSNADEHLDVCFVHYLGIVAKKFHIKCIFQRTIPEHRMHDMGRWRPPAPNSSPYITPAGLDALQKELKDIWLRRRDVVKALAEAAAEGDRSENAEYIYRKKELSGLDQRIRYLQKRLPTLKVVRELPNGDAIYFGAFVEVCDETGETHIYRIVGPDETDAKTSAISIDSPLAKALLAKRVDDEVVVKGAEKTTTMSVVSIRYKQPP
jgi:transcription elongation factor GreB